MVAFALFADGNLSVFSLFLAYNQHVRNTFHFVIANLTSDFFVTFIHDGANIVSLQIVFHFLGVIIEFLADRQDGYLVGCQPQREFTGGMLDEYGHEAFHRTERSTVNHYRTVLLVVSSRIFQLEAFGQVVIHLDSTQLPTAADSIFHHKVQFGTVESGFTVFHLGLQSLFFASLDNSLFRLFPVFIATDILFAVHLVAQRNLRFKVLEVHRLEYD